MRNHFLRAAAGALPTYITDNLQFHIDAGNSSSYSGSGTTVYNLIHNDSTSSYNSNIGYSTNNGGYWTFASNTGTGFRFDIGGSNNYLNFLSNDFTIEMWFRPSGNGTFIEYTEEIPDDNPSAVVNYRQLLGLGYQPAGVHSRLMFDTYYSTSNNNNVFFYTDNYIGDNLWSSNTSWIHYVVTSDASGPTRTLYKNGTTHNTGTNSNYDYVRNSSDNNLYIGGSRTYNFPYNGDISIVRIYIGKALSSTEVAQNYDAEKSRYGY